MHTWYMVGCTVIGSFPFEVLNRHCHLSTFSNSFYRGVHFQIIGVFRCGKKEDGWVGALPRPHGVLPLPPLLWKKWDRRGGSRFRQSAERNLPYAQPRSDRRLLYREAWSSWGRRTIRESRRRKIWINWVILRVSVGALKNRIGIGVKACTKSFEKNTPTKPWLYE